VSFLNLTPRSVTVTSQGQGICFASDQFLLDIRAKAARALRHDADRRSFLPKKGGRT
jgi:hypothetical protein